MKTKIVLIVISILLVLGGFILWKQMSQTQEPVRPFTIVKAWWPAWDTFQIGVEQREKHEKTFRTKILQTDDYVSALNDFKSENVDAATLTIYEAILAASDGIPLKIVLLLDYTIGSDGVVAKKNIRTLKDLEGKRVGVEKGSIAHFTVLQALRHGGLSSTMVQIVDSDMESLKQAFIDDKLDAVGTFEPYMSDIARQGNGHVIFSSREIPRSICDVLFVKENVSREYPEVIDHWINSWNDALSFKLSETDKYLRTLSKLNRTPIPDIKESFKGIFLTDLGKNRGAFGTPDSPGYLLQSMRDMRNFMIHEGVIRQEVPLKQLIDFDSVHRFFKK